jgi:hypothetical protein
MGVLDWLIEKGYQKLGLIGISLGSCIAGLVAAHDKRIQSSALLLTAGDFAEVIWTGRATRHIQEAASDAGIGLHELQQLWSIISTGRFARQLSRTDHKCLIISGNRDRVVPFYLTERFIEQLRSYHSRLDWYVLPCGHYSLGLFPFNVISFARLLCFLNRERFFPSLTSRW